MEAVMLKQGAWMKIGAKWMKLPAMMTKTITGAVTEGAASGMKSAKNLSCLDPQPIDGQSLKAFSFDSSGEAIGVKAKQFRALPMIRQSRFYHRSEISFRPRECRGNERLGLPQQSMPEPGLGLWHQALHPRQ